MPKTSARSLSLTSQESYSAVIIADMVAEVPIHPESEIIQRRSSAMKSKEETNFGYDGQMDTENMPPATVKLDAMVTVNLKPDRTNGGGISKGVLLNAAQFAPTDSKLKINQKIENQIPLNLPTQAPDAVKTSPTPSGFSDMSISRKIAFGFSFLPSILFVLCFAVLLPCENYTGPQPSVQEQWSITLNETACSHKVLHLTF
ncbi:uncharacterized protein LOC118202135 [Stegodyphus dumicola]|uniref:uncharacterized protein LOC118202135 n=1 Tax=Stegodyphus dumicola TaxID=202533 RepID=UPI0015AD7D61|nr:uncharacterized protein LOC118202135 [Stegodyphus dumicola]